VHLFYHAKSVAFMRYIAVESVATLDLGLLDQTMEVRDAVFPRWGLYLGCCWRDPKVKECVFSRVLNNESLRPGIAGPDDMRMMMDTCRAVALTGLAK
jgi:hypothetical protein